MTSRNDHDLAGIRTQMRGYRSRSAVIDCLRTQNPIAANKIDLFLLTLLVIGRKPEIAVLALLTPESAWFISWMSPLEWRYWLCLNNVPIWLMIGACLHGRNIHCWYRFVGACARHVLIADWLTHAIKMLNSGVRSDRNGAMFQYLVVINCGNGAESLRGDNASLEMDDSTFASWSYFFTAVKMRRLALLFTY